MKNFLIASVVLLVAISSAQAKLKCKWFKLIFFLRAFYRIANEYYPNGLWTAITNAVEDNSPLLQRSNTMANNKIPRQNDTLSHILFFFILINILFCAKLWVFFSNSINMFVFVSFIWNSWKKCCCSCGKSANCIKWETSCFRCEIICMTRCNLRCNYQSFSVYRSKVQGIAHHM